MERICSLHTPLCVMILSINLCRIAMKFFQTGLEDPLKKARKELGK